MAGRTSFNRALTWLLAGLFVLSLVGVGYAAMTWPESGEPYTEFYILGPGGEAADYPTNLSTGETEEVIVGIGNQERQDVTYRVVVEWNGSVTQRERVRVPAGETRERRLSLTAPSESGEYRVRFLLYRVGVDEELYRSLRLIVRVVGA